MVLPFSETDGWVKKPYGQSYPANPKTLGDYIRKRRLELRLLQKDVASFVGVCEDTVTLWENNQTEPKAKYVAKIIQFMGEVPPIFPDSFGGKVKIFRLVHGLTHSQMGGLLRVNGSTISAWEAGYPPKPHNENTFLRLLENN